MRYFGARLCRIGPSLVTPHICIGGKEDARNLEHLKGMGVTHILNCALQLSSAHPKEFVHKRLEILGEELVARSRAVEKK